MSILRRGSSRINDENFNSRLQRERAKTGAITASLAWNDSSDLDLHAKVELEAGGNAHICFRNKKAGGGVLDVDMHARDTETVDEPVENIFWQSPPAGTYSIIAHLYKKRGAPDGVRFRAMLKCEGEEDSSVEGELKAGMKSIECFRFVVDGDGNVQMKKRLTAIPEPKPSGAMLHAGRASAMRTATSTAAAKARARASVAKAKARAMAKEKAARAKARATASAAIAKARARAKVALARARAKAMVAKAKAKAKAKAARAKAKAKARAKAKGKVAAAKAKGKSIAKGKLAKAQVFKGAKVKTSTGLKKADLTRGKRGKIVTVKKHLSGKANKWAQATAKARAIKGVTGFRPLKKGESFYDKVKEIASQS